MYNYSSFVRHELNIHINWYPTKTTLTVSIADLTLFFNNKTTTLNNNE